MATFTFIYGAISVLLHRDMNNTKECQFQGFCVQLFVLLSTTYMLVITIMIYRLSKNKEDWSTLLEVSINCGTWVVPTILGVLPLYRVGGIHYTSSDSWCWIDVRPTFARFVFSYVYNWSIILFIIVFRVRAWYLHRSSEMMLYLDQTDGKSRVFKQLFWYPLSWIILWIPSTVNRLVQAFHGEIFVLTFFQTVVLPLQGAANAIVFMLTSGLLEEYKKTLNARQWESNVLSLY